MWLPTRPRDPTIVLRARSTGVAERAAFGGSQGHAVVFRVRARASCCVHESVCGDHVDVFIESGESDRAGNGHVTDDLNRVASFDRALGRARAARRGGGRAAVLPGEAVHARPCRSPASADSTWSAPASLSCAHAAEGRVHLSTRSVTIKNDLRDLVDGHASSRAASLPSASLPRQTAIAARPRCAAALRNTSAGTAQRPERILATVRGGQSWPLDSPRWPA